MGDYEIQQSFRESFKEIIEKMMEKSGRNPNDLSFEANEALTDAFMDIYDKYYK